MATYQYTVEGTDYEVDILEVQDKVAKVTVNGVEFEVELKRALKPTTRPIQQVQAAPKAATPATTVQQPKPVVPAGAGQHVLAPLPGTIIELKVNVGDTVKQGDTVLILEAMKMQNNIEAECDGQVTSVLVKAGDTVMEGAPLITIG